ncbi:MAG TPA: threonine/serine exporter family protein [Candidatus Eisenbacteria bacterium]|nr:threonine/serine exporter family protein [Candidatus Eisenbacteria bacterium]
MDVERALDVAAIVMKNGGSTAAAERSFARVLEGLGTRDVTVVWRLDYIAATTTDGGKLVTFIRPIPASTVNLTQAAGAMTLAESVGRGETTVDVLDAGLDRVRGMASPYGAWTRIVAAALAAGSFAWMTRCGWKSAAVVAVSAAAGQFVRSRLQARNLTGVPVTLAAGGVTAMVAGAGVRALSVHPELPTLIASTIYLVPGLALINGYLDMVSHRHLVVGLERTASALIIFLVLAIVVALASVVL